MTDQTTDKGDDGGVRKGYDKNSVFNTFFVATAVCLICSLLVSGAAVLLKSLQDANRKRDVLNNIIRVAGFDDRDIEKAGSVEACFSENIETVLVDLKTGDATAGLELAREFVAKTFEGDVTDDIAFAEYDPSRALLDRDFRIELKAAGITDIAGLQNVEKVAPVYLLKDENGDVIKYIFPVRGKGLWSILYGFVAVEPDFTTISGLTFYAHGETPGLGGEVDNPDWKKQWTLRKNRKGEMVGKQIFGDDGKVNIAVVKGKASGDFQVDGLAGATITSNGVTRMLEFWFGENGYGPFIRTRQNQVETASGSTNLRSTGRKGDFDG